MRGKRHSDELRAAVMASLIAGQGVAEVATAYHIDESVVSRWRKRLVASGLQELQPKTRDELETLLMDYVCQALKTLKVQSEVAGTPDYVKKQPASELAVLHGVMADKAVRILAALEPTEIPVERTGETAEQRVN